jgi:hypothetical protein
MLKPLILLSSLLFTISMAFAQQTQNDTSGNNTNNAPSGSANPAGAATQQGSSPPSQPAATATTTDRPVLTNRDSNTNIQSGSDTSQDLFTDHN